MGRRVKHRTGPKTCLASCTCGGYSKDGCWFVYMHRWNGRLQRCHLSKKSVYHGGTFKGKKFSDIPVEHLAHDEMHEYVAQRPKGV